MSAPREGEVYRHAAGPEEVLIDHVTETEVYLRLTDGSGGLIAAMRMAHGEWERIEAKHGLEVAT